MKRSIIFYPNFYPESPLYPGIQIPIPDMIRLYPDLGNTNLIQRLHLDLFTHFFIFFK